jgi:hypothetical protein
MSNNYGHVGVNPLAPMSSNPEHQLATLLKDNYDQSMTGIPFADIGYEQWLTGFGDYSIYFQEAGHNNVSSSVDHNIRDYDHYVDIHVFVRSMKVDYDNSAEKKAFDLEQWISKTILQHKEALKSGGIQYMEHEDTRVLPYFMGDNTDYDNLIYRKVLSVYMKIRVINQAS